MGNDIFKEHMIKRIKNTKDKTKIELCINNETELYNHFSITNTKNAPEHTNAKINNEIINYLMEETKKIPRYNSLVIGIKTPDGSNFEIDFVKKLIKENIHEKLMIIDKKRRTINKKAFILTFIGMILIVAIHIFHFFESLYFLNEFIIVMSWVFMWKATELFFFKRAKRVREAIILMKIYFSEMILEKYPK